MKQLFLFLTGILGIMLAAFFGTLYFQGGPPVPEGSTGPGAAELAEKIEKATDQEAWDELSYIDFIFNETGNRHLRDMQRNLARIDFKESGNDYRALLDLKSENCLSYRNGELLDGGRRESICEKAFTYHNHEFYLLNPFYNFTDKATLKKVGDRALLVQYSEDTFLIVTDPYFLPTHWKMWAQMSPLKGMETSFEKWERIPDGPLVSLKRRNFLFEIRFEIKGAGKDDISAYSGGSDPFADLSKVTGQ